MDETENQSLQPLSAWTKPPRQGALVSDPSRPPTCPDDVAMRRAAILLASYRKGEAEDPEIYSAAVAAVLSSYPLGVAYRVTDPRSGLPGTSQWLPTVAEVKAACEAEMAPARAEAQREARRNAARSVLGEPVSVSAEDRARAIREAKERHPDIWGGRRPSPVPTVIPDYSGSSCSLSPELLAKMNDRDGL